MCLGGKCACSVPQQCSVTDYVCGTRPGKVGHHGGVRVFVHPRARVSASLRRCAAPNSVQSVHATTCGVARRAGERSAWLRAGGRKHSWGVLRMSGWPLMRQC